MENKKEFLNEENYQMTKKKITKISLIILIVGLVIGVGLIVGGIITQSNVKKINEERYNEAYQLSQEKKANAEARLKEIENEKKDLNKKIEDKQYSCASLNMTDTNWYADSVKCQGEVSSLRKELSELETEEFKLEHADNTVYYDKVLPIKYIIFYILGGMTILISSSVAGIIYLVAKRREITAFAVQQTMPLAQEGMEKMASTVGRAGSNMINEVAPSVGNAVGTIGKELAKGIKEGLNEADKNK